MITIVKPRALYSSRKGAGGKDVPLDLDTVKRLFWSAYQQFDAAGYWQEAFGYTCVDSGDVSGTVTEPISMYVRLHTKKELWPIWEHREFYDEEDLFDMIEFLFDHVSAPTKGYEHTFGDCGFHGEEFDQAAGRAEFQRVMSGLLDDYGPGYELNERGEIMELGPKGLNILLKAKPPTQDADVRGRLSAAIDLFQRRGSTIDDRRHAVGDLAAVLEKIRPQVKEHLLSQDEKDLFMIANQFGIRHLNDKQRTDYDAIWLSWMFHTFLAAIHTCLHLVKRQARA
jgi:hypothetical protein